MGGRRVGAGRAVAALALVLGLCGATVVDGRTAAGAGEGPSGGRPADLPYQEIAGDPVSTYNGSFGYDRTDLRIAAEGPTARFARSYGSNLRPVEARDSARDTSWPLGPGWTHAYNIRLTRDPARPREDLTLWLPVAAARVFTLNDDGTYTPPLGERITLVKNRQGTFRVTHPDGLRWEFRSDGRLSEIFDAAGRRSGLRYDRQNRLEFVSDPAGRGDLRFSYDGASGLLQSVTDWDDPPRAVRFGYDPAGRLVRVIDREGGYTLYGYEDTAPERAHLLTSITDARNNVALTITYDAERRVVRQQDARGRVSGSATTFAYNVQADDSRVTTVTYPPSAFAPGWGSVMEDTYDANARVVRRVERPAPDEVIDERYSYDESWSTRTATNPEGRPVARLDDLRNRGAARESCLSFVGGAGGLDFAGFISGRYLEPEPPPAGTPRLYYPGSGLTSPPREYVDAIGNTVGYEYDRVGRIATLHVRAPADGEHAGAAFQWQMTYDREDRVRFLEASGEGLGEALGRYEVRYDAVGNPIVGIDAKGQVTRCLYDERDSLREVQQSPDPWTDPETTPGRLRLTRFEYDERGNLLRATRNAGEPEAELITTYAHDGLRRLRRMTLAPAGANRVAPRTIEYSYDENGIPVVTQRDP